MNQSGPTRHKDPGRLPPTPRPGTRPNNAAVRLYTRLGFKEYGLEQRALKFGGRYYDEVLMAYSVTKD
jgi:hypothetical protein